MAFRGACFDPTTGLLGDHIVAEGPETSGNPSMDVLADLEGKPPSTESWLLRTCSMFEDIQLEIVASQQQRVFGYSPTAAGEFSAGRQPE
jgi:hypothetical protein